MPRCHGVFIFSRLLHRPEVKLLVILPLTFFYISVGADDSALAVLLAIFPLACLHITVAEQDVTLTMQLVVGPASFVAFPTRVEHRALAHHLAPLVEAFVDATIGISLGSSAMLFAVEPVSKVLVTLGGAQSAFPVALISAKHAIVEHAIFLQKVTPTVARIIMPLPTKARAICPDHYALAMAFAVMPLAKILRLVRPDIGTEACALILQPFAFVSGTCRPFHYTPSLLLILVKVTTINDPSLTVAHGALAVPHLPQEMALVCVSVR